MNGRTNRRACKLTMEGLSWPHHGLRGRRCWRSALRPVVSALGRLVQLRVHQSIAETTEGSAEHSDVSLACWRASMAQIYCIQVRWKKAFESCTELPCDLQPSSATEGANGSDRVLHDNHVMLISLAQSQHQIDLIKDYMKRFIVRE